MKYLTIDTTTKVTALSLGEEGRLVAESFVHTGKTHSERLIPMLDQVFTAADWQLSDLDFIGVVHGPGSFTGIRIGIATAQGLGQVLNIPVMGIGSLDTLSWAGCGRKEDTVVILDARKNEWYSARYRWTENMEDKECLDFPRAVSPRFLTADLAETDGVFFFVGDALPGSAEYLRESLGDKAVLSSFYQYLPRGAYACCEVWHQLKKQNFVLPSGQLVEPCYLRLSEAEVNYRKKQLQNS